MNKVGVTDAIAASESIAESTIKNRVSLTKLLDHVLNIKKHQLCDWTLHASELEDLTNVSRVHYVCNDEEVTPNLCRLSAAKS